MAKANNNNNGHALKESEVTFARDLGLFDATMIGVGAMIGAGIFVLTGIAAGEAGPGSLLAFGLNALVTLLTAFAYAELASALPRAGGGYSYVRLAFPGGAGFVSGWMLWFAYIVACSLYALGFAGYFWEFLHKYLPTMTEMVFDLIGRDRAILVMTFLVGTAFTWLNIRGAEVTGKTENFLTLAKIGVLGIFLYFGLERVFADPDTAFQSLTPFLPKGFGGVLIAMGLTFIAFEGYDLIATVAEEIKDPEKNIPRATFISLGIAIIIYMFILFVSLAAITPSDIPSWQFLGNFKETAIVRAAEDFMPAFGVAVIVAGGLLSTMSALNATVMAASRVAFAMARDLWLPKSISKIHSRRRTPHIAVALTGAILIAMALTLPIEAVGSAASLIFLLTFALVNLSVIVLRRKHPEIPRRYRVPFYPYIPIAGIVLNVFLAIYQFSFSPIAWYVTIGWITVGLLLYYAVFEKKSSALKPQVLVPEKMLAVEEEAQPCVMVALHNPANVEALLDIAHPIAQQRGLRLLAVSVVKVPRQMPITEGMRLTHHKEAILAQGRKVAETHDRALDTKVVIAHHSSDGILAATQQHKAQVLVMGWKGYTNTRDRLFGETVDRVVRQAACDLIMIKMGEEKKVRSVLLPTAGGPNALLAASVLRSMTDESPLEITAGYVLGKAATEEDERVAFERMEATHDIMSHDGERHKRIIHSESIPGGIARVGREYDMVVIGAAKEPFFRKVLFGEIPEKVARYTKSAVMVVKQYEGPVKSILKRVLG